MTRRPRHHAPARGGFTLVEMILATVLIGLVAAGTVTALSSAVRSRDAAAGRAAAFERAVAATSVIADDLVNLARDANPMAVRVMITPVEAPGGGPGGIVRADTLMLASLDLRRTRPEPLGPGTGTPESITHEVQYRAEPTNGLPGMALWRRDDPTPDEYLDSGGVARVVTPGVVSVLIQAADQASWRDVWDSDLDGYPHAVRITVIASDDSGKYTSTARRTIAIDRTPLPITASKASTTTDQPATDTGTNTNTGNTNTGNTTTGGGGGGQPGRVTAPGGGGGGPGAGGGGGGGGPRPGGGG